MSWSPVSLYWNPVASSCGFFGFTYILSNFTPDTSSYFLFSIHLDVSFCNLILRWFDSRIHYLYNGEWFMKSGPFSTRSSPMLCHSDIQVVCDSNIPAFVFQLENIHAWMNNNWFHLCSIVSPMKPVGLLSVYCWDPFAPHCEFFGGYEFSESIKKVHRLLMKKNDRVYHCHQPL